jgi:hypothetical protein
MAADDKTDDTFELDLRVEAICHILCGAKPGDYFTLELRWREKFTPASWSRLIHIFPW